MYYNIAFDLDKNKYLLGSLLGTGSYGVVASATDVKNQNKVAIKKVPDIFDEVNRAKNTLREVKMLHYLRSNYVEDLLDIILTDDSIYMVTEIFQTDLHHLIYTDSINTVRPSTYLKILYHMLSGVEFLHAAGVLHRDIKPANVFLDSNLNAKIGDFGLARYVGNCDVFTEPDAENLTDYVVTRWYRAPEVVLVPGRYGKAQDVWAVACTMGEFIRQDVLFSGDSVVHQLSVIVETIGPCDEEDLEFEMSSRARRYIEGIQPEHVIGLDTVLRKAFQIHDELFALMKEMLQFNPHFRLSCRNALAMPIFMDYKPLHKASNNMQSFTVSTLKRFEDDIKKPISLRAFIQTEVGIMLREINRLHLSQGSVSRLESPVSVMTRRSLSPMSDEGDTDIDSVPHAITQSREHLSRRLLPSSDFDEVRSNLDDETRLDVRSGTDTSDTVAPQSTTKSAIKATSSRTGLSKILDRLPHFITKKNSKTGIVSDDNIAVVSNSGRELSRDSEMDMSRVDSSKRLSNLCHSSRHRRVQPDGAISVTSSVSSSNHQRQSHAQDSANIRQSSTWVLRHPSVEFTEMISSTGKKKTGDHVGRVVNAFQAVKDFVRSGSNSRVGKDQEQVVRDKENNILSRNGSIVTIREDEETHIPEPERSQDGRVEGAPDALLDLSLSCFSRSSSSAQLPRLEPSHSNVSLHSQHSQSRIHGKRPHTPRTPISRKGSESGLSRGPNTGSIRRLRASSTSHGDVAREGMPYSSHTRLPSLSTNSPLSRHRPDHKMLLLNNSIPSTDVTTSLNTTTTLPPAIEDEKTESTESIKRNRSLLDLANSFKNMF